MPLPGIFASSYNAGGLPSSYDALATITVPSGGLASVTFAAIPSGYQHLQMRILGRTNRSSVVFDDVNLTLNGDTGANYSYHAVYGTGTGTPTAYGGANNSAVLTEGIAGGTASAGVFGSIIIDILDYANTTKNKTIRSLGGVDNNGSGNIFFNSAAWFNTSAINSIKCATNASLISEFSSFALYGVK